MALDRTWYNTLVDDDGTGTKGTIWNKSQVNSFINTIDAALGVQQITAGPWTPQIGGTGGASGQVYSYNLGYYTRIGKLIVAEFVIGLSTRGTISGDLLIYYLPAVCGGQGGLSTVGYVNLTAPWIQVQVVSSGGNQYALLRGMRGTPSSHTWDPLNQNDIASGTELRGTLIYHAST